MRGRAILLAMFWSKKVRVVFVDVADGKTIASSDMPPAQLPESFEAHTTVNIAGREWEVISSTPMTRAEFVASGKLRIELRAMNVATVSPKDLLYSLPTICDVIPPVAEGSLSKNVLELHEDHWRQIELVSAVHVDTIRACFAKIQRVLDEERVGAGFKNLYLRSDIAAPIAAGAITLDALRAAFGSEPKAYEGVAYEGAAGLIANAFAFGASSLEIYGLAANGDASVIGFMHRKADPSDARALGTLLEKHRLVLVDWCRVALITNATDLAKG